MCAWLVAAVCLRSDESGAYYWHIKSGTIQRERPSPVTQLPPQVRAYAYNQ